MPNSCGRARRWTNGECIEEPSGWRAPGLPPADWIELPGSWALSGSSRRSRAIAARSAAIKHGSRWLDPVQRAVLDGLGAPPVPGSRG